MKLFFKLNNHKGGFNQVAYYHHAAPHDHVTWNASANRTNIGQELYLSSNQFGVNGTVLPTGHQNQCGHFGYPAKGDLVVIFQQVFKSIRIVTHVLEFADNQVSTFQQVFGQSHPNTVTAFAGWPYLRKTKIVAVLKPSEFGGVGSTPLPDLVAHKNPINAVSLDHLTGGSISVGNGRIYETYGQGPTGHRQLTLQSLKVSLSANTAYDTCAPL